MIMQAIFWTVEEVAQRAKQFYENGIRQKPKPYLALLNFVVNY
jgi:hypothetical protein